MSRIARVELHQFRYTVDHLGFDAGGNRCYAPGVTSELQGFVVVVIADDGSRGEFCPAHSGKSGAIFGQTLALAPALLGHDPEAREALYDHGRRLHRHFGGVGYSSLDIALWDLAGKRLNRSVAQLLGGYRTRLPAYASSLTADRHGGLSSKEAFADFAQTCRDLGFRGFKIHGWCEADPAEESANILHLRRALGPGFVLMYDGASELRTFADALQVGRACDEASYTWYEDPFRDTGTSPHAHRRLRQMIRTPLLLTEHVRGVEGKAAWLTMEATDFLRADPEYDGGITATMKLAHLAEAFGMDLELHAAGVAQRHCMAAIRNSNWYELSLVAPGVRNPVPPVFGSGYSDALEAVGADGCYPVPSGPGLGVELDWDYIARYRTALHVFPKA
jgi:L-alanine-DL-glutamate epimerase-like enolase superfamily enzyme